MNNVSLINKDGTFDFKVEKKLLLNLYNDKSEIININIIQKENSLLVVNFTNESFENSNININVKILGDNNKCILNFRGLAGKDLCSVNVIVKAEENTKENIIVENLKGLCDGGQILIKPILEIDTNEVEASHFVTVGPFNEESINYLKSLGISKENTYNLLKKSFKYSIFNDEFLNLLNFKEENNE